MQYLSDPLAYVMAGVQDPLRKSLTRSLFDEIANVRGGMQGQLLELLAAAAALMIPLDEYDVTDFNPDAIQRSVQALKDHDLEVWAQLLYALNQSDCEGYGFLKAASPFRNELLMFPTVDGDGRGIHLVPERAGSHYGGFSSELPINPRPGNVILIVIPEHVASQVRAVPIVNYPPATA